MEADQSPAAALESFANEDVGSDEHFQKFFRLEDDRFELDKVSLLACSRQGIQVEELMFRPLETFREKNASEQKQIMRFNMAERRRQAKLKLVEEERELVLHQLFFKSTKLNPTKQRELASAIGGSQPKSPATSNSADGAGAVPELLDALLATGSSQKSPSVQQGGTHLNDFERIRNRELKQVEIQLWQELQQEELHRVILERSRKEAEQAEARKKAQDDARELSRKVIEGRMAKVQETNDHIVEEKRQRFESVERQRQEREARRLAGEEQLKQERALLLENKLRTVAERNKLVTQSFENRCQMQLRDIEHRQALHTERRRNIELHRGTVKEISKIKSLQKAIAIREAALRQEEEEELWKYQLLEKHQEAEDRLKEHQVQMQSMLEDKKNLIQAKEKKRQELKVIQDMKYQEILNTILEKHYQKEQHLLTRQQKIAQLQDLRAEIKQLKLQNWVDNRRRLSRAEEYREMVTQAKIEADRQRTEELLVRRQREHGERMRFKQMTQLEKEALLKEIQGLKSSCDPHVLLNKSEQLALLSAGGARGDGDRSPSWKLSFHRDGGPSRAESPDGTKSPSSQRSASPSPTQRGPGSAHPSGKSLRQELRNSINRRVGDNVMHLLDPPLVAPKPLPLEEAEQPGDGTAQKSPQGRNVMRGTVPPGSTHRGQLQGGAVHGSPVAGGSSGARPTVHRMQPPSGGHCIPVEPDPYGLYLAPQPRTALKTFCRHFGPKAQPVRANSAETLSQQL
eukprot:GGOE01041700.1.p1 GENE.GGOE01041700.1~~GGOE01041700.1.p1  ORF type:complete len:743 (-),score=217.13 GGOE01041700.1:242-2470(-)